MWGHARVATSVTPPHARMRVTSESGSGGSARSSTSPSVAAERCSASNARPWRSYAAAASSGSSPLQRERP